MKVIDTYQMMTKMFGVISKIWFKNLNSFFDFVEKQLKVQIKIAPHPKIKHKNLRPHYYSGRKIIRHDLAEIAKY